MGPRRRALLRHAQKMGCDAVIAFEPENLFYLTNFWGEGIGILEKGGRTTLIAPGLEAGRAGQESVGCRVVSSQRGSSLISDLADRVSAKKPCTDCQSYTTMKRLKKSLPKIVHSAEPFVSSRIIKDSHEISILRQASRIIDEMFEICTKEIRAGVRESQLQSILMSYASGRQMFDTGYRFTLNPLIIAGGENGALPHAQVSQRKFRPKDLIVVDLTLRYRGYVSDATRTFGLGRISEERRGAYDAVKESQRRGLDAVRPGSTCGAVDAACRDYLAECGYEKYFIHSTGHGIGLDVHEQPNVSYSSKIVLQKEMAITVEPGVYLPGKFGIRIEDSVIVKNRASVMHKFTKDLLEL